MSVGLGAPSARRQFAQALRRLQSIGTAGRIAVALSGGPDSVALAILAKEWSNPLEPPLAMVVDHQLRPESSSEADSVAAWASGHGLQAVRLAIDWHGHPPQPGRKMAQAREARYSLLAEACQERGVGMLLLGHHSGDQAETFLLRLSRASGLHGLACMPEAVMYGQQPSGPGRPQETPGSGAHPGQGRPGRQDTLSVIQPPLRIVRPLLCATKQELVEVCRTAGVTWVTDPSNSDDTFQRVAIRQLLNSWPTRAVSDVLQLSTACRSLQAQLETEGSALLAQVFVERQLGGGTVIRPRGLFRDDSRTMPHFLAVHCLGRLVQEVAASRYPPRTKGMRQLLKRLIGAPRTGKFVVHGCEVAPAPRTAHGKKDLVVIRQYSPISRSQTEMLKGDRPPL